MKFETVLDKLDGEARKNVEAVYEKSKEIKTGAQVDGTWVDPAYAPVPIFVSDIIAQAVNPNFQSEKAFSALCTSILNSGMAFPVLISENSLYDPECEKIASIAVDAFNAGNNSFDYNGRTIKVTPGNQDNTIILDGDIEVEIDLTLRKPKCFSGGQDTVDVRNPKIRAYYKYQVIDGCHRLLAVLYGSPMYKNTNNEKAREIYKRCRGYVPCTFIHDKTEQELMSATILFNPIAAEQEVWVFREV